jgi:prophage regulatory protein
VLSRAVDFARHWSCGKAVIVSIFHKKYRVRQPQRIAPVVIQSLTAIGPYPQRIGRKAHVRGTSPKVVVYSLRGSKVLSDQNALPKTSSSAAKTDADSSALAGIPDEIGFLRLPEVRSVTGLSKSSLYALIRANSFPAPVQLGPRTVAWVRSEIKQWAAERIKASRTSVPSSTPKRAPQRATAPWPTAKKWA